jgi:plasmid stabilization system protein ParE
MRVRWTTDAADDLERICDYIAETDPDSARRIGRSIVEGLASLRTFPNRGRRGRVEGYP